MSKKGEKVNRTGSVVFGKRLSTLRKARGWSQEALGHRVGFSASGVSNWEVGVCLPRMGTSRDLAKLFGVDIAWLLSDAFPNVASQATKDESAAPPVSIFSEAWADVKKAFTSPVPPAQIALTESPPTIRQSGYVPMPRLATQERQDGARAMGASDFTSAVEIAVTGLTEPEAAHATTIAIALFSPCRISDEQIDAILSAAENIKRIRRTGRT